MEFIAVNTDAQALSMSDADVKVHIGGTITKGLGAGADPRVGSAAAEESREELKEAVRGADMVFVTAGEGGGTGTGAAPVIAQTAREQGALTVGVVTRPFTFEGAQRTRRAEEGISALEKQVNSVIIIPNERLIEVVERRTSIIDAFRMADDVLRQGVQGITDLITVPGLINLDFADVRTIMQDAGASLMGIGTASGENRAAEAAKAAISSPLLETTVAGATGVLLNITGGPDLGLFEIDEAAGIIRQAAHDDCNVIFGAVIDENAGDMLRVTVIATGFDAASSAEASEPRFGRRERAGAAAPRRRDKEDNGRAGADDHPRGAGPQGPRDPRRRPRDPGLPQGLLGASDAPSQAARTGRPRVVASGRMAATLSRTSLHGRHAALGARMGAFAGWDMPLYYSTARAEHRAVRERCGVFDVSHMGQLEVSGAGAREALARLLTNDIDEIGPGRGQYTLMCEDDGGVIDDLIAYALADRFLLVVNASNVAACRDRLADRLPAGVALADRSREVAMMALQGPAWKAALSPHLATPLALSLDYFEVGEDMVARRALPHRPHRLHRRARGRADVPVGRGPRGLGRPHVGRRPARAGRAGRARHPAPGDGLPALRAGALARAHPDRGRPSLGLRRRRRPLLRRRGHAPPGRRGDARAARHLPPDRAGHPARRPGRARGGHARRAP